MIRYKNIGYIQNSFINSLVPRAIHQNVFFTELVKLIVQNPVPQGKSDFKATAILHWHVCFKS